MSRAHPATAVVRASTLVLGAALAVLAGCGSGGSASPSRAGSGAGTSTTARSPAASTSTSVSVPSYVASQNARPDLVTTACAHGAMGWRLSGKVANTASTPRRYSIVVDFVTAQGDTVVATRLVEVPTVAANGSATWSTPWTAVGQSDLTCVVRYSLWSS